MNKKFHTLCIEHELILLCLQRNLTADKLERIKTICGRNPDWDHILSESLRQCLGALVYRALSILGQEYVPENVLSALHDFYNQNAGRNLRLVSELRAILDLFERNRIDVCVYKGPLQAAEIYGNLALRHICDLDLIVRREEVSRVFSLLLENGFEPSDGATCEDVLKRIDNPRHYDCSFHRRASSISIEIHWQTASGHMEDCVDINHLWSVGGNKTGYAAKCLSLDRETRLLLLCAHNEKHNWQYLKFICDIAWLLESGLPLDCAKLLAEAEKMKVMRSLHKSLFLVRRLLEIPLPDSLACLTESDSCLWGEGAIVYFQIFKDKLFFPTFSEWRAIVADSPHLGLHSAIRQSSLLAFSQYIRSILAPESDDSVKLPHFFAQDSKLVYVLRVLRIIKYWIYNRHVWQRRRKKRMVL